MSTQDVFQLPAPVSIPINGAKETLPIGRIFCVGRNYAAHAAEMGVEVDREAPFYFTKSASHAVLSGGQAPYPPGTENYHYEMELAIAIGAPAFCIGEEEAGAVVYGYCCALDMTRRDLQIRERKKQRPWDLGKDVENGAVFAPITKVENWTPSPDKKISLQVNGTTRQDATLGELIWSVEEIISHLSGFYHLRPGDLIMTGTPAGVGPTNAGDHLIGEVDGLAPVTLRLTASK